MYMCTRAVSTVTRNTGSWETMRIVTVAFCVAVMFTNIASAAWSLSKLRSVRQLNGIIIVHIAIFALFLYILRPFDPIYLFLHLEFVFLVIRIALIFQMIRVRA